MKIKICSGRELLRTGRACRLVLCLIASACGQASGSEETTANSKSQTALTKCQISEDKNSCSFPIPAARGKNSQKVEPCDSRTHEERVSVKFSLPEGASDFPFSVGFNTMVFPSTIKGDPRDDQLIGPLLIAPAEAAHSRGPRLEPWDENDQCLINIPLGRAPVFTACQVVGASDVTLSLSTTTIDSWLVLMSTSQPPKEQLASSSILGLTLMCPIEIDGNAINFRPCPLESLSASEVTRTCRSTTRAGPNQG